MQNHLNALYTLLVSISDDLPYEIRAARKLRMSELKEYKAQGCKVFFRGIELYVNGSPVQQKNDNDLILELVEEELADTEEYLDGTGNGSGGSDE